MELVLQRDGHTVQWAFGLLVFGVVCVEGFGVCNGGVEKCLVEAVDLDLLADDMD